jgi:hypothetical protein
VSDNSLFRRKKFPVLCNAQFGQGYQKSGGFKGIGEILRWNFEKK